MGCLSDDYSDGSARCHPPDGRPAPEHAPRRPRARGVEGPPAHPASAAPTPVRRRPPPVRSVRRDGPSGRLYRSDDATKGAHINYAFGNVTGGKCTIGDAYADYDKAYTADQSVDGVADTWDQPLRGNFNQLRKLKKAYPNI
ncbi:hypothetical protein ACWCQ0_49955, partial [Streptomyces massasporeus]